MIDSLTRQCALLHNWHKSVFQPENPCHHPAAETTFAASQLPPHLYILFEGGCGS